MYYVWRIAATCLTPATHRLCMQKKCRLPMQICILKANVIACFSSTWENTTAFFFFLLLRNKVGGLKVSVCIKNGCLHCRHCFRSCCIFALLPKGCQTVSKQRSRAQDLFFLFFSFSHTYQCCCVCTDITSVRMYLLPLFRSITITEPRRQNQMIDSVTKNTLECLWPLYTSQLYCNVMRVTRAEHFLILKTSFYRFLNHKWPLDYI